MTIPNSIWEHIKKLEGLGASGTIVLHMKDGAILSGEFQPKIKLGLESLTKFSQVGDLTEVRST